jgi:hypothetical protein
MSATVTATMSASHVTLAALDKQVLAIVTKVALAEARRAAYVLQFFCGAIGSARVCATWGLSIRAGSRGIKT